MQNTIRKIILFLTIFAVIYAAIYTTSAASVHKVKSELISIVTTDELYGTEKLGTNQVIIEKCLGVVDQKNGYGHVVGHPDWTMHYGAIRYKGKKLKPGTKVLTYFPCDPTDDNEPLCRYDFIKVKKNGKKEWKLVHVDE